MNSRLDGLARAEGVVVFRKDLTAAEDIWK
jgi:hypothetical protein